MEGQRIALSAVMFQPQGPDRQLVFLDEGVLEITFELTPELIQRIQMIQDLEMANDEIDGKKVIEEIKAAVVEAGGRDEDVVEIGKNVGMQKRLRERSSEIER